MSVRQIYETAFDSTVKVSDADYLDDLAQSPVICGSVSNFFHERSAEPPSSRLGIRSNHFPGIRRNTPSETEISSLRSYGRCRAVRDSGFSSSSSLLKQSNQRGYPTELSPSQSSAKDSLPYRPHSDPLDRRKADSNLRPIAEQSSRSNPVFHLPLEQSRAYSDSSASKKTFSPSTEFKKLEVGGETREKEPEESSREEATCSTANDSISTEIVRERPKDLGLPKIFTDDKDIEDDRPAKRNVPLSLSLDFEGSNNKELRFSRDDFKRNRNGDTTACSRMKLNLDFGAPSKKPRRHLLNFWTPGHDAFREVVDPTVELEKQGWYHGTINHKDAENALRMQKEGSFLVRCCKTSQRSYSLSIKSAGGVMHIKIIQSSNGRFILKQQSQSFDSIPEMVWHFSLNPLPAYGLERVLLRSPVISRLL